MRQDIELDRDLHGDAVASDPHCAWRTTRRRRGYLDWLRGLAVLIMIEAHVIDSWTRLDARGLMAVRVGDDPRRLRRAAVPLPGRRLGGAVRRIEAAAHRRSPRPRGAVMKRGAWIFVLAFLFRVQAWILGLGSPRTLLKVDILNIMGPSIVAAAALWGAFRIAASRAWRHLPQLPSPSHC